METSLGWYDFERTILYLRLSGNWEMDASRRVIRDFHQRIAAVPYPVDLIAFALDRSAMHPPVWVARMGVSGILGAPKNFGHVVLVPESPMILALADVGSLLLGGSYIGRIHTASSLDAARQVLRNVHRR